jgi:hypothetical protein
MAEKKRFIDDEEEDVVVPKKKRVVEDEEDEPVRKPRKQVDDEEEAPRKRRPIEEEEDEPVHKKKARVEDEEEDTKKEDDLPQGIDVDFGDERIAYKKARLPRLSLKDAKVARFALIPGFKVKAANTHFIDGSGTYACLANEENPNPICCQKLNEDQKSRQNLRALALVVHYTNAKKDGTLKKDPDGSVDIEWEIKYLRMSRKNYNDIFGLKTEDESVYDFDITMSENTETGIGFKFNKISNRAWWQQDPELRAEILEAAEAFRDGKDLSRGLGRKIDELEYKALLRKVAQAPKKKDDEEEI